MLFSGGVYDITIFYGTKIIKQSIYMCKQISIIYMKEVEIRVES